MNCYFKFADRVAAGEISDGVSGEKQDGAGIACHAAQLRERVALVSRKPVLQEVDVVGHGLSYVCHPHLIQVPDAVALTGKSWKLAKQNINTS